MCTPVAPVDGVDVDVEEQSLTPAEEGTIGVVVAAIIIIPFPPLPAPDDKDTDDTSSDTAPPDVLRVTSGAAAAEIWRGCVTASRMAVAERIRTMRRRKRLPTSSMHSTADWLTAEPSRQTPD